MPPSTNRRGAIEALHYIKEEYDFPGFVNKNTYVLISDLLNNGTNACASLFFTYFDHAVILETQNS